jgi:hypothetical protein
VTRRTRPPHGIYSIADLARREGISAKSARGRLRKYFGGTLADLGISEWTYGPEDFELVLGIIHPNRSQSISRPNRQPVETLTPVARQPGERVLPNAVDPYSWPRKLRNEMTLPSASGVYALFLRENSSLPEVVPLEGGLIYIGLGSSLAKRCHFNGSTEGHSPRRSLAALLWQELGLEPELLANGNYKLSKSSEKRLDAWMHENLLMAFDTFDDFEAVEDVLIRRLAPPLNLTKCAQTQRHRAVKQRRKAMLNYALGLL